MANKENKASRASFDVDPTMTSHGAASDTKQRKNTLDEALRKTAGPEAVAFYARQNPAINTAMTARNIDCVNDGAGGFRDAESIDEVLEYGTERRGRLSKEIKGPRQDKNGKHYDGERHAVTVVGQLPMSLCEPDGTFYHPLDRDGLPKDGQDGRELVSLPRYRATDEAEMRRYFDEYLNFLATDVLPGGQESIHGFSINLDETRPHIQVLADPFMVDPRGKEPDALKSGFSRAFGSHRSDTKVVQTDKRGNPKMVGEGARRKYERYHRELKAHMIEAGFDIEAERDEVRHDRRVDLKDYKEIEDQRQHVAGEWAEAEEHRESAFDALVDAHEVAEEVERDEIAVSKRETALAEEAAAIRVALDDRVAEIDAAAVARTAELDQREAGLSEREAEIPQLRAAAVEEGRAEGLHEWELELPTYRAKVREEIEAALSEREDQVAAKEKKVEHREHQAELTQAAILEGQRQNREAEKQNEADRAKAAADRAEAKRRLEATPQWDDETALKALPAEMKLQLREMKEAETGQPVLQLALERGQERWGQAHRGSTKDQFLTETDEQREQRVAEWRSDNVADLKRMTATQSDGQSTKNRPKFGQ